MPKSARVLLPTERLNFLVDKITTSGKFEPDREWIRELCERCCEDLSTVQQVFRLLRVQLAREHAQIRQGVLKLVTNLSDPVFVRAHVNPDTVKPEVARTVCKVVRDLVLRDLQDFASFLLRTEDDAPTLPRPFEIARQVERQLIELILKWEADMKQGRFGSDPACEVYSENGSNASSELARDPWTPSAQSRGQLTSFLTYLRCSLPSGRSAGGGASRTELARVQQLVRELEREQARTRERARAQRDQQVRKERKRVTECIKRITDSADMIEENLTTLTNALELLVPDPFTTTTTTASLACTGGVESTSYSNPMDTMREHGLLLGSSSGLGLASAQGSIEIRLPGCLVHPARDGDPMNAMLSVPVELNDTSRPLVDTARECAQLARDKHRPLLLDWIEILGSSNPAYLADCGMQTKLTEQLARAQSWLERVDRLVHLFFDRIVFTENGVPVVSDRLPATLHEESEDSSDVSDLEEVGPLSPVSSRSTAVMEHTDSTTRSPITTSVHMSSTIPATCSSPATSFAPGQNSPTVSGTSDSSVLDSDAIGSSRPKSALAQSLFEVVPSKSSVIWRANESAHKFWRPIDPEEHEAPREYYEDAISLNVNSAPRDVIDDAPSESSTPLSPGPESADASSSNTDSRSIVLNRLACWAPLLRTTSSQSKRLCPRRDPSGRCPIHGRIVPRDPHTGRPVNPHDREQLQAEMMAIRKAKLESKEREFKRLSRRRYPGLVDLNARPRGARHRLQSRVLNPRAVRKVLNTLNATDEQEIANRFSDNFTHAVKPR